MTEQQRSLPNSDTPWLDDGDVKLYHGDAQWTLNGLPDGIARTCVTSPPYWGLRDYGHDDQHGTEATPEEYVARMVEVFREVRRVLTDDGTLWLNIGDTYVAAKGQSGGVDPKQPARRHGLRPNDVMVPGLKPKDLVGIPWMLAFALRADGWFLRCDVVWSKPNAMPEPVRDRPGKAHEYLFLLAKSRRYFYDADAIKEPDGGRGSGNGFERPARISGGLAGGNPAPWEPGAGRNKRSVWTVPTTPYPGAHFAVFPPDLIVPCILAGSQPGDMVLDPFMGSGTTALVARTHGRRSIGVERNDAYLKLAADRLAQQSLLTPEAS